jgi:hypothetical protein
MIPSFLFWLEETHCLTNGSISLVISEVKSCQNSEQTNEENDKTMAGHCSNIW